jgi:hypothetical protein
MHRFLKEQQQLGLPFLIKRVWIAFLIQSLNRLQVGTLLDNISIKPKLLRNYSG